MSQHTDIPSSTDLMFPLLQTIADGELYSRDQLIAILGDRFGLTKEQRERRNQANNLVFGNRIDWVRSHFTRDGYIETPKKGHIRITPAGQHALKHRKI